jgi:hypothetical protein
MNEKFKIVARQEYEVKGVKKVAWNLVGILIENGDKRYVTLNMIPNTLFHVFPMDKPEAKAPQNDEVQF